MGILQLGLKRIMVYPAQKSNIKDNVFNQKRNEDSRVTFYVPIYTN